MNKVEVHCKTKYTKDYDSVIDVEAIIYNSKENKERGIIFIDKESIYSFTKIESIYNNIKLKDKSFNNYKVGYGVELTININNIPERIILLITNKKGLNNLYKIMNNKTIDYILNNKEGLLLGLIYTNNKTDLSIFDYIEINSNIKLNTNKLLVYSNIPNIINKEDSLARTTLSKYKNIKDYRKDNLYLNTKETLNIIDNKEIVIDNSNKLLDMLDNLSINDNKLTINKDNYERFKELVLNKFNKLYKNPSLKTINRLEEELYLIKELNYTYYFNTLLDITNYCNKYKESYLLEGYSNNLIVTFILGISKVEPIDLPYELFFSNNLNITLRVNEEFYYKKLFKYINTKYNLSKCKYGFKIDESNVLRVIKNYEIKTKANLDINTKDYISNILLDIPVFNDLYSNTFFINGNINTNYYDYHDLLESNITLRILPTLNFKLNNNIKICNNKNIYNLIRTNKEYPYLKDIPNLNFNNLINYYSKNKLIEDEVYNYLKALKLEDIIIFNIINKLKEKNILIPKYNLINKSYLIYSNIYNKYIKE